MSLLSEYREFIARGNVVDLAVGVIIGAAFGKVVTSLVEQVVMPPIGLLIGKVDFSQLKVVLTAADPATKTAEVAIAYGAFINTVIQFLLVGFVIFLMVKAVNSMRRREAEAPVEPAAPTTSEALLTEIRDLLKTKYGAPAPRPPSRQLDSLAVHGPGEPRVFALVEAVVEGREHDLLLLAHVVLHQPVEHPGLLDPARVVLGHQAELMGVGLHLEMLGVEMLGRLRRPAVAERRIDYVLLLELMLGQRIGDLGEQQPALRGLVVLGVEENVEQPVDQPMVGLERGEPVAGHPGRGLHRHLAGAQGRDPGHETEGHHSRQPRPGGAPRQPNRGAGGPGHGVLAAAKPVTDVVEDLAGVVQHEGHGGSPAKLVAGFNPLARQAVPDWPLRGRLSSITCAP
jgi:large conductance mechanosensitive channel